MGLLDIGSGISKGWGMQGTFAGDVLGGGSESASYNAPHLDDVTTKMILDQQNRAQESPQEFSNRITHGTDQTQELQRAQQGLNDRMRARGGSDFQAMGDALQNKASKSYGRDLANIQRQSKTQAIGDKFNDASASQQNMMSRYQVASGVAQARNAQIANAEIARNQMIGNIVGAGGQIVGMIMGAPPSQQQQAPMGQAQVGSSNDNQLFNNSMNQNGTFNQRNSFPSSNQY